MNEMLSLIYLILSLLFSSISVLILFCDALLIKASWDIRKYGLKYLIAPGVVFLIFFLIEFLGNQTIWGLFLLIQLGIGGLLFLVFWNTDFMIGNNPQLTFVGWYYSYFHYYEKTKPLVLRIYRHSNQVFDLRDLIKMIEENVDGKKLKEDKQLSKLFNFVKDIIEEEDKSKTKVWNVEYLYIIDYTDINVLRPFKRIAYVFRERDEYRKLEGNCVDIPFDIEEYGIKFKNILMVQGPRNETIIDHLNENLEIVSILSYLPTVRTVKNIENERDLARNQVAYLQKAYNKAVASNVLVVSSVEGQEFELKFQMKQYKKEFYTVAFLLIGVIIVMMFFFIMFGIGVF